MVNTSKYPSNPQGTSQSGHPGVTFRAILLGIILIPAEYLLYYGEPSALLEYAADDDVADLQCRGDADGVDVPEFLAEVAVATLRAPTGGTPHGLRHSLAIFGDRWARHDADGCTCHSERFLVCDTGERMAATLFGGIYRAG